MVNGTLWVEARLRIHPQIWIAAGLLAAAAAGFGAWLASRSFLTALAADVHVPLVGDVHLSSILVFDVGVYMLVVGATALMLVALAHQSLRSPRRVATPLPEAAETEPGEATI
jgi:multicomponent K+:H+ antiporter subunit A